MFRLLLDKRELSFVTEFGLKDAFHALSLEDRAIARLFHPEKGEFFI